MLDATVCQRSGSEVGGPFDTRLHRRTTDAPIGHTPGLGSTSGSRLLPGGLSEPRGLAEVQGYKKGVSLQKSPLASLLVTVFLCQEEI